MVRIILTALYNVVGGQVGSVGDYKYSKALAEYNKEWTIEELNGYLIKPAKWIKGTKWLCWIKKRKDRASVIKYLNQNQTTQLLYLNFSRQYSKILLNVNSI